MVDKKIIYEVFEKAIKDYPNIIDSKCKYESFEYTDSNGNTITLKVREVKKPKTFMKYLKDAFNTQDPRKAWRVEIPKDNEADSNYQNTRMYVTRHGSTIAVRDNGDIISVCGNNSGVKESSGALLSFAVSKGGDRLDSFDGNYGFYRHMGFEPVSYCDFVEEFAPPSWQKGRDTPEPIVFFKYTGERSEYLSANQFYDKVPMSDDYDGAHLLRDNDIIYNSKSKKLKGDEVMKAKGNYPLTQEEFNDKVIGLLIEEHGGTEARDNKLLDFATGILDDNDDDYFEALYLDSCYRHDKYGMGFSDDELINQPVRLLYLLYGD